MGKVPKPEHGSLEWHQLRHRDQYGRVRFGASEAPTLMGCNPFETVTDLALRKWSPPEVTEATAAMARGNYLEPALVAYAADVLGQPVSTPDEMFTVARLIATLDGLSADGETIIECKTTTAYSSDDQIPDSYYWQAVAQLGCVPTAHKVLVVVLDKRMRLGSWEVVRSDDVDRLFDRADEIGDLLDGKQLPPDAPLTEKHVRAMFPEPSGSVELGANGAEALELFVAWKARYDEAEAEMQSARDRLVAVLGPAEIGTVDGSPVVSYKSRKGSSTVDWKAVARDHGSLLDKYRKQGAPTRVLKVYE